MDEVLSLEKRLVFIINFFLIVLVILIFVFNIHLKYFFYIDILVTLFVSYLFFLKSKRVSKDLIITNLFIFCIFLFPFVEKYLYILFGSSSYFIRLFYLLSVSYIFIQVTGSYKEIYRVKGTSFKVISLILIVSLFFGMIFYSLREPYPLEFKEFLKTNSLSSFFAILFNTFSIALTEELMIIGVFYSVYKSLTSRFNAISQASIIFLLFHLIRFYNLAKYYFVTFGKNFLFYLVSYYIALFVFMVVSLNFYSFKREKYKGNILYSIIFHALTDFSMLTLYLIFG